MSLKDENLMSAQSIPEEELSEVSGGIGHSSKVSVTPLTPYWVRVTADSLNCRYTPNGEIAKVYERGHKLKIDGITTDDKWYRLLIYDPRSSTGGTCYGYIFKAYTERIK